MEPDIVAASEDVLNVAEQSQDPNSNGETKGNREKRPRNEKRSEYEYNADIINENTIIPPLPKKSDIIPKPDMKEIKEKESRNRERIDKLIEKKVLGYT